MAKKRTTAAFLKTKELVIENLEYLHLRVDEYTNQGMSDESSLLYNRVITLLEKAEETHTFQEFEEIISKGKQIEHHLDAWHAQNGGTSIELKWPSIEPFL